MFLLYKATETYLEYLVCLTYLGKSQICVQICLETIQNVFETSLLCSPRLHLFDQKYSNIVK